MTAGIMKINGTDGRVIGMKLAANNMPPREKGLFWEICREGERGCHYFKPLLATEVEAIERAVKEREAQATAKQMPSAPTLLAAVRAAGVTKATKTELDEIVARLWIEQWIPDDLEAQLRSAGLP